MNPTFTYAPSAVTKIQLSYEYFHDQRTTDRVTFSTTSTHSDSLGYSMDSEIVLFQRDMGSCGDHWFWVGTFPPAPNIIPIRMDVGLR